MFKGSSQESFQLQQAEQQSIRAEIVSQFLLTEYQRQIFPFFALGFAFGSSHFWEGLVLFTMGWTCYDFTRDVEGDRASVAAYWLSKKTKETEQGAKSLHTGTLLLTQEA